MPNTPHHGALTHGDACVVIAMTCSSSLPLTYAQLMSLRPRRVLLMLAIVMSCGRVPGTSPATAIVATPLVELFASGGHDAWQGIAKAVNLRVGEDGRVWVADNDAQAILVFDSTGRSLGDVGRNDDLGFISYFVMLDSAAIVLDTARTLSRLALSGTPVLTHREIGYEQALGALGPDKILMASSVRWTGPARPGERPWALARVVNSRGDSLFEMGRRAPGRNPFVDHITNFIIPAGSGNGQYVWLAHLNSPDVSLFTSTGRLARTIARDIPFDWHAIPSSFAYRDGDRRVEPGSTCGPQALFLPGNCDACRGLT